MIDFGKLYCDLHPNQIITNFCIKETCMTGLCATCICSHTENHVNNKTTPQYQNIRATFSSMHQTIRKKITSLENQKSRIEKITSFIQTKRKALKQNIEQTRTQAIDAVNKFFDNREKLMLREMESEQKKMGLHNEARMESLMNSLGRETSFLITSAQELNSLNFLQSYQRIKTQTLLNATKLEQEIARELDKNQDFETIINTNDEYIHNIMRVLEQSLHLTFKMNSRIHTTKPYKLDCFQNESATISLEKQPSKLETQKKQKLIEPLKDSRPSSAKDSTVFQALSFSNIHEISKQQTSKFNHYQSKRQTTKSIQLDNSAISELPLERQNKSITNQLKRSEILNQHSYQNPIFCQKDKNLGFQRQSLSNRSKFANKNYQSQLIITQKPLIYQTKTNFYDSRSNFSYQNMQQSVIEKIRHFSQQKYNINTNSPQNFRNQPVVNLQYLPQNFQPHVNKNSIISFVSSNLVEYPQSNKMMQNKANFNDCRKVKKSGLSILKTSTTNGSARAKFQDQ